MNLELIKELDYFDIHSNLGLCFDGIDEFSNYSIAYSNNVKDYFYNFITNIKAKTKNEFDKIILDAIPKMNNKNREIIIAVLPYFGEIYNNKEVFFDNTYKLVSKEVWQIYDDLVNIKNINTNCNLNIKLEKTENMKLYAKEMLEAYQTGDNKDPYGSLDSEYKKIYENYKEEKSEYKNEFYFIKMDNKIIGVTSCVYDNKIFGIYGLAIKKEYRKKGFGKETIKKQLEMCKNKNLKLAFLQTEEEYYPADMYRKLGFKDVCIKYYYKKI